MKNKENLPDILLKANNATTVEESLNLFGINKVLFCFSAVNNNNYRADDYARYGYSFVGNLKDNRIEIEKFIGRQNLESNKHFYNYNLNYQNLVFEDAFNSGSRKARKIINGYLHISASIYREARNDSTKISFFYNKDIYEAQLKTITPSYLESLIYDHLGTVRVIPDNTPNEKLIEIAQQYCKNIKISLSTWEKCKKKICGMKGAPIQKIDDLEKLFKTQYPYVYDYYLSTKHEVDENIIPYLCCPQIEILAKAGYGGLEKILKKLWSGERYAYSNDTGFNQFNILIKEGNSPKEIIQMSPKLANCLKECSDVKKWDTFRKLEKKKTVSTDFLVDMYEEGYDESVMKKIGEILRRKYDDKNIFTQESLLNYLERLDRFEAIDRYEAAQLLSDYLRMCQQLNLKPKIDGDSLKREHDICARMVRQIKKEGLENGIVEHGKKLSKFSFAKGHYKIVPIQDYDDLIQQANSQHNCVASYAESISKGKTNIFKLYKDDKRFATIQIDLQTLCINQAYLAYNQPASDEVKKFLNQWVDNIKLNNLKIA